MPLRTLNGLRLPVWSACAAVVAAVGVVRALPQSGPVGRALVGTIGIDVVPVPLNPQDPSQATIGDFAYAGGLVLSSRETDRLHGLSDLIVTGRDTLTIVGDGGVLVTARLVLDDAERLAGVADARVALLAGVDGEPLVRKEDADAEGLARLPSGDLLVSFERRHRIWLYPEAGGAPRPAPAPDSAFPENEGMEALTADPDGGLDAYVVGGERTGAIWTCRLSEPTCVARSTVAKPAEFGLVAIARLPDRGTAYLLRAFEESQGNRIVLVIDGRAGEVARLALSRPLTVDNFEGLAAVPRDEGGIRFYLLSDDNGSADQRTLLVAFDWRPSR